MMTHSQGQATKPPTLTEGTMPPLQDPAALLTNPTGAHSLVMRLVGQIVAKHGQPVEHELLQWYADDQSDVPAVVALGDVLGPRPRRTNLYIVIGDLIDLRLLRQEPDGLYVTEEGQLALKELAGRTASFDAVIV
jgi:hypothetical protein